ncbi:hypothetical protein DWX89_08665 [Coprobacillus sp. AF21-8LB]|nr:hypothetical protein DW226_11470 [Coprobacillus sp. AM18-4LB-d2]RHQ84722.1 hypothetical protein DWX89_08665 [Coprobacillus sp. AF21-8LB]
MNTYIENVHFRCSFSISSRLEIDSLFHTQKSKRENINKLVKRLLTGTPAFATILTATPKK